MLARYARLGVRGVVLLATRGGAGMSGGRNLRPGALARVREDETRCAAAVLGVRDVIFLDHADGAVDRTPPDALEAEIRGVLERVRPQVVITFGPEGVTRHPDHIAVGRAATAVFHTLRPAGFLRKLYYVTIPPARARELGLAGSHPAPTARIDITEFLAVKARALRCHATQADAQEMAARVERGELPAEHFYCAYPPPVEGELETDLFESVTLDD